MVARRKSQAKLQGKDRANNSRKPTTYMSADDILHERNINAPITDMPKNSSAYYIGTDGVLRNRHVGLTEKQKAIIDAKDYGFEHISVPFVPEPSPNSLQQALSGVQPPGAGLATDDKTIEWLMKYMETKLKALRDILVVGVNEASSNKNDRQKRPTSEEPAAQFFADPKMPLPISYYAQDRLRHILHYKIIIEDERRQIAQIPENSQLEEHAELKRIHQINKNNEQVCRGELRQLLADQLPGGEEEIRLERAQHVMNKALDEHCRLKSKDASIGITSQGCTNTEKKADCQADVDMGGELVGDAGV